MRDLTRRSAVLVGGAALAAVSALNRPGELFVLGDSWAAGLYADPVHALGQVAAAQLGWSSTVDAVSGTGYVQGEAQQQSYPDRLRSRDPEAVSSIAVLQGGSNDRDASARVIAESVLEALALVRARLPAARPVMLGPGPDPMPVTPEQWAVDRLLCRIARQEEVPYVSMLQRAWITGREAVAVLDPVNHHPTVEGQRYLGGRLATSLRQLYPRLTRGRPFDRW